MNIGFDAKRALKNTRGLGNYSRNIINGLSTYYPENKYILYSVNSPRGPYYDWVMQNQEKFRITEPVDKSKISELLWRSSFVRKNIKNDDLDIYHGLSHEIPYGKKNGKTKYVVTIHDLLFLRYPKHYKWLDIKIYLQKVKYACKNSDLILAVSQQTKEDLINFLNIPPQKITVNYQSCNRLYYELQSEEVKNDVRKRYQLPEYYYLFVGAIVKQKNIGRIVESLHFLPKEFQHPLVIVGKGDYMPELLQIINKFNLTDKVKFINYVPDTDMPAIYQLARILVWPSLFEGFGIPIIEALFSKLPVITGNVGCFPEVGGPMTTYINPEIAEDIASAITEIMSDRENYANMQQQGFEYVQKFHIKNTTKELFDIYTNLAKA